MKNLSSSVKTISQKGFTLIELLVVIAIVAVLAVAVVVTLNPAELLRQARDSTRITDLASTNKALGIYLASASSPNLGDGSACYIDPSSSYDGEGCNDEILRFTEVGSSIKSTSTAINGTGWIPVNLTQISFGAPISAFPRDPVGGLVYYYAYRPTSTLTFELNARFESAKFNQGGTSDRTSRDGGSDPELYEVGSNLNL